MLKKIFTGFLVILLCGQWVMAQKLAKGVVFLDQNKNGVFDQNEQSLANVCVSNGRDVAQTDEQGRWKLPVIENADFFVIKPADYQVPINHNEIPQHYYLYKPKGSPPLKVPGVAATGPLPESIDFPLYRHPENNRFSALFFGDTQARGLKEVNYISHDVVDECIGTDAIFGVSLGDIVADDPELFAEISGSIAQIGIPWYNVFGNHDFNRGATDNQFADDTFERYFGPSTYAYEYGQVAFIVLNDIYFNDGHYKPHFTQAQLDFVRNYLSCVPENKLVVLMMHVPIIACDNREEMFSMLEKRPFTFSIAGHTHEMAHVFVDDKMGWKGPKPHHLFIDGTVCGSWWCGIKDELGIPHATMNDGSPNGYAIITFDGNQYDIRYKAARKPADYQMNIFLPDDIDQAVLDTTKVIANIFSGSERSAVEMRFDKKGAWIAMNLTPGADPSCVQMQVYNPYLEAKVGGQPLDEIFGWEMDVPGVSTHIWNCDLPTTLTKGTHLLTVRTTDMFGHVYSGHRVFRVR